MPIDPQLKEEIHQIAEEIMNRREPLTSDEARWVRLAIKAEVERSEFRKAVIEKSLIGLIWAVVSGGAVWIWQYLSTHIMFK